MQTTNEIVESLARQRVVEGFLERLTGNSELSPDFRDLAQMVYLVLLRYKPERLNEAVEEGFILFLVANIIKNLRKAHSEYSQLITRYQLKAISFKTNIAVVLAHFAQVKADYEPVENVEFLDEMEERANAVKRLMATELTEGERNILILYSEFSSIAEVAKVLGVAKSTARLEIVKIRNKILKKL